MMAASSSVGMSDAAKQQRKQIRSQVKELKALMKNFKMDHLERYLGVSPASINANRPLSPIGEDERNTKLPVPEKQEADKCGGETTAELVAALPSKPSSLKYTLQQVVAVIESTMSSDKKDLHRVVHALANYDYSTGDWKRYEYYSPLKRYTRNLISTDSDNYTLMLLCWNPNQSSPIHDHAGSECFMLCVAGEIIETQYDWPSGFDRSKPIDSETKTCSSATSSPACTPRSVSLLAAAEDDDAFAPKTKMEPRQVTAMRPGTLAFINDSIGLHRVGNATTLGACSLHCYIPPYNSCRLFDDNNCAVSKSAPMSFDTQHGERCCDP